MKPHYRLRNTGVVTRIVDGTPVQAYDNVRLLTQHVGYLHDEAQQRAAHKEPREWHEQEIGIGITRCPACAQFEAA